MRAAVRWIGVGGFSLLGGLCVLLIPIAFFVGGMATDSGTSKATAVGLVIAFAPLIFAPIFFWFAFATLHYPRLWYPSAAAVSVLWIALVAYVGPSELYEYGRAALHVVSPKDAQSSRAVNVFKSGSERSTVFGGDKASQISIPPCSKWEPGSMLYGWVPSADQVVQMEPLLDELVTRNLHMVESPFGSDLEAKDYLYQFGGITLRGRRVLHVNGIHRTSLGPKQNWKFDPILVCSGGLTAFGVDYDTQTSSFYGFRFSGSRE